MNIFNRLLAFCIMMTAMMAVSAQPVKISGTLRGDVPSDLRLYIMPVSDSWVKPDSVSIHGTNLVFQTSSSSYNLYKLVGVASQRQVILPFHIIAKDGTAKLNLSWTQDGGLDIVNADTETKVLLAFNRINIERSKRMWMEGKGIEAAKLKFLVMGYPASADSLVNVFRPSATTAQYLRLWASTLTFEGIEGLKFATGRTPESIGIDANAEIGRLVKYIDCPMSTVFDSSSRLVLSTIPEGTLADRLTIIESSVKDKALRTRAEDALLSKYVASFNYAEDYEAGLKELVDLTTRFNLDAKYIGEFKMRKASIVGTPFPKNVSLFDLKGNKVDISRYRGKYVYVDMWASWCVPCIKEIPHLKALEKNLQNKDVVFLSISIDNKDEAWKKKVSALGLHGELLINKDNKLAESLNVRGIPFFLIYDKEGKLYMYNAYRPSDTRLKPLLEGLK